MTGQAAFTIVVPVAAGEVEELGRLLDEIGDDIDENPHLRFAGLDGLHYASLVIFGDDRGEPQLLFEGNVDGRVEPFLEQLVDRAGTALDAIYSHCHGYPPAGSSEPSAVVDFLARRDIGASAFFVAWPGRTVEDIGCEQQLRSFLGRFLDDQDEGGALADQAPEAIRRRLQQAVDAEPSLAWARTPPDRPFLVQNGRRLLLLLAGPPLFGVARVLEAAVRGRTRRVRLLARAVVLAGAVAVAVVAGALRRQERASARAEEMRDPDWETVYAGWSQNLAGIVQRENVQGQNHLASVCPIREGRLRLALLRVVLWVVNLVARLTANRGSLAGISSIHFARWVITPDRRHLIFLSNFDGSWERYLNDFIDLASKGLTAVWTNTDNAIGFPLTRWLILDGARDEQRFKAYARFSQVRTRAWYSAYPDLSNENVENNRIVREQLLASLDDAGTEAWLGRL